MVKDHLGNICAVVNANTDTVVQRTMYYVSGVPMAQSWGRETQPDTGLTEYYSDTIALPLRRVQGVLVKNYPKLRKILFCPQIIRINRNFRNDRIPD